VTTLELACILNVFNRFLNLDQRLSAVALGWVKTWETWDLFTRNYTGGCNDEVFCCISLCGKHLHCKHALTTEVTTCWAENDWKPNERVNLYLGSGGWRRGRPTGATFLDRTTTAPIQST
jgi:hypothetical protein